ncbi:hypothetical protein DVA67_035075 [Solirubrobacter sp. CPCC 204708]|nr:hypothetical protein [Solirubrobacter deserti]
MIVDSSGPLFSVDSSTDSAMANNEDRTPTVAGSKGKTVDEKIEALMKVVQNLVRQREEEDKFRAHTNPMFDNEEECSPKPKSPTFFANESILMSSKIEALEKALRGIRKSDDLVDMSSLSLFPKARLPSHFRMPELEKFDGMGCPKTHLKMYVRAMQPRGADDELLAQMFHETLIGSALKWFLALDESRIKTWEDVCTEFSNHYRYNTEVDVTRRDLETTKQEPRETFSAFIMRWRAKASQMIN